MKDIIFNASTVCFTDKPHYYLGTSAKCRHANVANSIGAYNFEFIHGYNYGQRRPEIDVWYNKSENTKVAIAYYPGDEEWDFLESAFK